MAAARASNTAKISGLSRRAAATGAAGMKPRAFGRLRTVSSRVRGFLASLSVVSCSFPLSAFVVTPEGAAIHH